MLDGTAEDRVLDVADAEADTPDAAGARGLGRLRVLIKRGDETAEWFARRLDTGKALDLGDAAEATAKLSRVARMGRGSLAEKRRIILAEDEETGQPTKVLLLLADPGSGETAEENSAASAGPQTLSDHLSEVRAEARRLVARIGELVPHGAKRLAEAVILAAEWHDRGKDREAWQADIGHARPRGAAGFWEPWAKSGRRGFVSRLSGEYRHELGSLREATADPLISEHPERELILHLIAAHHGWARPHFEGGHWDIAEGVDDAENEMVAAETMRRFARLERRFGHWGLAWLEVLLRAADYRASRRIASAAEDEPVELRPAVTLAEPAPS